MKNYIKQYNARLNKIIFPVIALLFIQIFASVLISTVLTLTFKPPISLGYIQAKEQEVFTIMIGNGLVSLLPLILVSFIMYRNNDLKNYLPFGCNRKINLGMHSASSIVSGVLVALSAIISHFVSTSIILAANNKLVVPTAPIGEIFINSQLVGFTLFLLTASVALYFIVACFGKVFERNLVAGIICVVAFIVFIALVLILLDGFSADDKQFEFSWPYLLHVSIYIVLGLIAFFVFARIELKSEVKR